MSVQMEVWGDYALWTRLELKTERYSYDVPTPSGARGMLESVYWHPGLRWHIQNTGKRNSVGGQRQGGFVYRPQRGYPAAGDDDAP